MRTKGRGSQALALSIAVGLVGLVGPSSAGAATPLGETFTPTAGDDGPLTVVQTGSPGDLYTIPSGGVLTSWAYQAPAAGAKPIGFKLLRPTAADAFTTIGQDGPRAVTAGALNSFPLRIPVQAGDKLGLFIPPTGADTNYLRSASTAFTARFTISDPGVGTNANYPGSSDKLQLDVSAILEPDCDSDGFGDETQDGDIRSCPPAPETTITGGPQDKTKKKQATFAFTANEAGATLECSVDGGPFSACSSPDTFKVKKGKHHFEVRATDVGGNVGSPASDDWKVKKKKRK
jgi:hypothetical protein